jgi:hypothetical protein
MIGVPYELLYTHDPKFLNNCVDADIHKREQEANVNIIVGQRLINKLLEGLSGSKNYSQPIEPILLHEETDDEIIERNNRKVMAAAKKKSTEIYK